MKVSVPPEATLPVIVCAALLPMICEVKVPPATLVTPAWRSKLLPLPAPTLLSVSYTHLDVYKRQSETSAMVALPPLAPALLVSIPTWRLVLLVACGPSKLNAPLAVTGAPLVLILALRLSEKPSLAAVLVTVSYTHLDVYKRQGKRGGWLPRSNV